MKRTYSLILGIAVTAALAACSSTPEKPIAELETARAIVPQVEASPRAGVAAENIANARKALDAANQLAAKKGKANVEDIRYEATVASTNAQIANEKILEAQAKDELAKGESDRQQVLVEARNREAQLAAQKVQSLEQELKDLKVKAERTDRGLVLTLGDVLFDTGRANLKPGAYATIDRLAQALKEDAARKVIIEGHTDSVGSDELNQTLSQNRAMSVQAALMERGVSSSQITAMGKGESSPVATNDDAAGRQQTRRGEVIFTEAPSQRVATD
jgi:outer membrane protein OmpA-like peptidoglycan-associated protein